MEVDESSVLEVRMIFNLIDCGLDFGGFEDGFNVWLEEVGDSDAFCFSGCVDCF